MSATVTIKQDAEKPMPVEVIAASIAAIADGIRKIRSGRLNDRALILLIQHAAPGSIGQREIKAVLNGIESLERMYLRPKKPGAAP